MCTPCVLAIFQHVGRHQQHFVPIDHFSCRAHVLQLSHCFHIDLRLSRQHASHARLCSLGPATIRLRLYIGRETSLLLKHDRILHAGVYYTFTGLVLPRDHSGQPYYPCVVVEGSHISFHASATWQDLGEHLQTGLKAIECLAPVAQKLDEASSLATPPLPRRTWVPPMLSVQKARLFAKPFTWAHAPAAHIACKTIASGSSDKPSGALLVAEAMQTFSPVNLVDSVVSYAGSGNSRGKFLVDQVRDHLCAHGVEA